jgi:Phage-related minor tail protein
MINALEVGAVFRIVDEATIPLRKILAEVRALNDEIKLARDAMAGFGGAVTPGIGDAIGEVNLLTAAWARVEAATLAAARAARASSTSVPGAGAAVRGAATAAVGGGGGFRPGIGGAHITSPGIPLGPLGHARLGGNAQMAGAAVLGLSLYEAANMGSDTHWLNYHLGRKDSPENDAEDRKLIEDTMKSTGLSLSEVGKSITDIARIMRDTPGFDVVKESPRLLRAALTESLSKGTTLDESVRSLLGMTHMVQAYKPGEMEKLYQVFAYLSTANPASLGSMEKTFSYAVPILRSGADIDPKDAMLLSIVLSTSGVTSSKAGTWLREFGVRAMPGNAKHNAQLQELGLLDENGKPTWYTNGKPDLVKALEIAGPKAAAMSPEQRLPLEMDLFGRRGGGAFAVLGGPTSIERYHQLQAGMNDPGNINRYETILGDTMGTSKMVARTTLQEFNVALIELGTQGLPAATAAVKGFSTALGIFTGGHRTAEDKSFSPNMLERLHDYLQPFGTFGASTLPKGPVTPSIIVPQEMRPQNQSFTGPAPRPDLMNAIPASGSAKPMQAAFSLNVDGHALAQSVIDHLESIYGMPSGAAASDGVNNYFGGDHQYTSI